MSIEMIRAVLGWSAAINIGVFLLWFLFFCCAHDWVYRLHTKWFDLTLEKFDAFHYAGLALYKFSIILFVLAPYLAIRIVT